MRADPLSVVGPLTAQTDDSLYSAGDVAAPSRESLFESGGFVPPKLGRLAEEVGHLRLGPGGDLWRYENGVYRPDGEEWLAGFVRDRLTDEFRRNRLVEIRAWCHAHVSSKMPVQPSPELINVRNGLLRWRENPPQLESHSPDVPSMIQLPVEWNPAARSPAIFEFLRQVLPEDDFEGHYRLVVEWCGYLLVPTTKFKRAVMLVGPSDTGRSRLLGLFEALLGSRNVANATLQAVAGEKFTAADLYGRLANISADLDAKALQSTGLFKMLVSGDPLRLERKYEHAFNASLFARLMFSANEAPGTADQSDAYFSRWLILPMTRRVPRERRDPDLLAKVTTPEELSGLLVHAVAGLKLLMARGRFSVPAVMENAAADYRRCADAVVGYTAERIVFEPEARTRTATVYTDFGEWCRENNRHPLGAARFKEHVTEVYPQVGYRTAYRGHPTFFGLRLRDAGDEAAGEEA